MHDTSVTLQTKDPSQPALQLLAVRANDFFLADRGHMYIFYLFLFKLGIHHNLLFLGYITAGGDFGPSMGHRDAAWA